MNFGRLASLPVPLGSASGPHHPAGHGGFDCKASQAFIFCAAPRKRSSRSP